MKIGKRARANAYLLSAHIQVKRNKVKHRGGIVASDNLTPKQKKFCELYIINGGNATKAAKEAGYSERSAHALGQKLLTQDIIQRYIKTITPVEDLKRVCDAQEILEYLTSVIRREYKEYVVVTVKKETRKKDSSGKWIVEKTEEPKIVEIPARLSDSNKAADMMGKYLQLWSGAGKERNNNGILDGLIAILRGKE